MAEENEQQSAEESHGSPPPQQPEKTAANGAGKGAEDGGADDLETVKAELDRERRAKGQLLNEKQKWAKGEEERRALKERLQKLNETLDEHGIDDQEQLLDILRSRTEGEMKQARDKGEVDKLLENQAKKFQREIEKREGQIRETEEVVAKHRATIDALTVDAQITAELTKLVEPSLLHGAFALHRAKGRTVDDPEAPYGLRVVMDLAGDEWKVSDYFKNWAETDPDAQAYLIGNKSSGGGAPAGTGRGAGIPRMKRSQMDARTKSDFINEHGIERYNSLPW